MAFCPSCGFNLTRDEKIERDGFSLDPRGSVMFEGRKVPLTPAEAVLMHTVAAASGRSVRRDAIASRFGMSDDPAGVASVMLCRIRHRLSDMAIPCPIQTDHGRGYSWRLA